MAPRRGRWLAIPEEDYPGGLQLQWWIDFPEGLLDDLRSGTAAQQTQALCQIFLAHNGWCDGGGHELPPPRYPAFWERAPAGMRRCAMALLDAAIQEAPQFTPEEQNALLVTLSMQNPAGRRYPRAYLLDQVAQRWRCSLTAVKAAPHVDVEETLRIMSIEAQAKQTRETNRKILGH